MIRPKTGITFIIVIILNSGVLRDTEKKLFVPTRQNVKTRAEKIEYLKRLRDGEDHPLNLEPFYVLAHDDELEDDRDYFLLVRGRWLKISRAKLNLITAPKYYVSIDEMNV